ncbi:MAG: hypothetical protein ABJB40_10080, partial [Acidobacteriota bacterium]
NAVQDHGVKSGNCKVRVQPGKAQEHHGRLEARRLDRRSCELPQGRWSVLRVAKTGQVTSVVDLK